MLLMNRPELLKIKEEQELFQSARSSVLSLRVSYNDEQDVGWRRVDGMQTSASCEQTAPPPGDTSNLCSSQQGKDASARSCGIFVRRAFFVDVSLVNTLLGVEESCRIV